MARLVRAWSRDFRAAYLRAGADRPSAAAACWVPSYNYLKRFIIWGNSIVFKLLASDEWLPNDMRIGNYTIQYNCSSVQILIGFGSCYVGRYKAMLLSAELFIINYSCLDWLRINDDVNLSLSSCSRDAINIALCKPVVIFSGVVQSIGNSSWHGWVVGRYTYLKRLFSSLNIQALVGLQPVPE